MLADRVRMGSYRGGGNDTSGSPGECKLIAGDMNAGYFGEVNMSELISGNALASLIGLSAGTSQFSSTAGWLKFAYQGKIQFIAKKSLRHSLSWDDINAANAVYGGKTVQIGGLTYKVRLMKGALTDPSKYADSDRGAEGSEWNKIMLPIHIQAKDKIWAYPTFVENDIPYWGIDFTDENLLTHYNYGDGSYSWCQETSESDTTRRVVRGRSGVSYSVSGPASNANSDRGWRPVLEIVN